MSIMSNTAICRKCEKEFSVTLEWLSKEEAIEIIKNTVCPKCGSNDWYFADTVW